jgi:hypothetical protein
MHFRANCLLGNLHQLNSAIGMMEGAHVPRYVLRRSNLCRKVITLPKDT